MAMNRHAVTDWFAGLVGLVGLEPTTLTGLSLRLMTPESRSKLIAHSIELEDDGIYRIAGIYRNEPLVELQGDRSEIHHGSLLLEVYGTPPESMEGHYWTDRGTRGTMTVTDRKKKVFDTFENVEVSFDPYSKPAD